MEHITAKNRRFQYRKACPNGNPTASSPLPRHFASTPKTTPKIKPSPNHSTFQSLKALALSTSETDAKILIGLVPTILALGILIPYDWLSAINAFPLVTILTGFGMLGRENYLSDDNSDYFNGDNTNDSNDKSPISNDRPPPLLHSRTSSLSTESSTKPSIIYSDCTIAVEGITVPMGCDVNGTYLDRQGSALRCFAFFRGISIRVYVATLYSSQPFSNAEEILETSLDAPLQLDFTFLRGFTAGQCQMAWKKQLDDSVTHLYESFADDKQLFLEKVATQSMKANGTISVQLVDDKTLIFDQGKYTGVVVGKDFQRAFLSMWFGDKPVTEELKTGLIGQEA